MSLTTEVSLAAAPAVVLQTLCAVRDWPAWLPTVDDVQPLEPDRPDGPGARYRVTQPRLGTAVWEVSRWERDGFEWRSRRPGVTTLGRHRVEATGDGSRVTLTIEWRGPLAPLVRLLYGRMTSGYLEQEARALRERVATR